MSQRPLISFCIATYNRGAVLVECLRKIVAGTSTLPGNARFEILVVDNGSTDDTVELVKGAFASDQVCLIELKRNCGPVAKNVAIGRARGEFLVLLDDDAYPGVGAVAQMVRHFGENPGLGAAVFDVTLTDGSKESSAYPDVFIGAGTGLRRSALEHPLVGGVRKALPGEFFMQAEEYDLSFRLLDAGYSVQRFWDLPLVHLKSPGARVAQRTTGLDVRNNLYLLAKYVPDPLATELAADWLARYFMMATVRDRSQERHAVHGTHKQAYIRGAAEGLGRWTARREKGRHLLKETTIERIFKFEQIEKRMARVKGRLNPQKIIFADLGKNMMAYFRAAQRLRLPISAIVDDRLAGSSANAEYRGVPIIKESDVAAFSGGERATFSGVSGRCIVVSNMSPIHGPARAAALRRVQALPVVDLFSRTDPLLHGSPIVAGVSAS